MENLTTGKLILPALRAHMGDWTYYITFLKMKHVAERIHYADEVHPSKKLSELIQRQLESRRSDQIASYLTMQEQRFFNSIVVGLYKGAPEWYEFNIRDNHLLDADDLPKYIEGALGLLVLTGEERLFALDGQHRVAGIKKAIKHKQELGEEEISVIFIAHHETFEGRERTRRLFTSLNRYAKPVSTYDKIALDEDDMIAIIVRRLVENYPLFSDERISSSRGPSIPTSDKDSITTLGFLYKILDNYLKVDRREMFDICANLNVVVDQPSTRWSWSEFKKVRPDDRIIEYFYQKTITLWDIMQRHFTVVDDYLKDQSNNNLAYKYRNHEGGNLLFRPVGLEIVLQVITWLVNSNMALEDAVKAVASVPMLLQEKPWVGILWNNKNGIMITSRENRSVAAELLLHLSGADISQIRGRKHTFETLKRDLAGILARDEDQVDDYLTRP